MKKVWRVCLLIVFTLFWQALAAGAVETGYASWYGGKFQGRLTANGEIFDTNKLTAAHRTLDFNTVVKVTNLTNGKSVEVRINDRGPFVDDRIIDLSRAAAAAIDMVGAGIAPVEVRIVRRPPERRIEKLPPLPSSTGWIDTRRTGSIQIVSLTNRERAAQLAEQLSQGLAEFFSGQDYHQDVKALITRVEVHQPPEGGTIFRLMMPHVPLQLVDQVKEALKAQGFAQVLVRQ